MPASHQSFHSGSRPSSALARNSFKLDAYAYAEAQRAALDRMEVDIGDRRGFVAQPRLVVVGDGVLPAVEEIQHVERHLQTLLEAVGEPRVEDRGRPRAHAVVLEERPRPEGAPAQAARPPGRD